MKAVLTAYMKAHKINQSALGLKLGVDRHQVSKWINGIKSPKLETRKKMARKLGISITELL